MKLLKFLTILIFFILVFSQATGEIRCFDIWLHLKTGEYILKEKTIPRVDIYSYTRRGTEWINHEWLTQIIFYSIYNKFGLNSLIILQAFVIIMTFLILFRVGYRERNYSVVTLLLLAVLFLAERRFLVRPEIFTLFFTSVFFFVLNKYRDSRLLYLLPLIQLFWANMHGYFLAGAFIIFIYIIAETVKRRCPLPFEWNKKYALSETAYRRLLVAGILIVAASFINPYGWKGFMYPFVTLFRFAGESKIFFKHISELTPLLINYKIQLPHLMIPWFRIVIIVSALSFLMNYKKVDIASLALYVITLIMAVKSNRHIAIFCIASFVAMITNINESSKEAFAKFAKFEWLNQFSKSLLAVILIFFMLRLALVYLRAEYYSFEDGRFKRFRFGVSSTNYPKKAVDFIEENKIKGNILNDFNSGAYSIWRLFPEKKVFIDGRTEIYGPDFFKYYYTMFQDKRKLEEMTSRFDINCILYTYLLGMPIPTHVLKFLHEDEDWVLVYLDDRASVFVRNTEENKKIIDTFEISKRKPDYDFTESDIEELKKRGVYPYAMIRKAIALEGLGLYEKALEETEYALRIMPDCARAFKISAASYIGLKEYDKALECLKKGLGYTPRDIVLRKGMGFVYTKLGDYEKSLEQYKGALYLDPSSMTTHLLMGNAYISAGRYEEAISEFEEAFKESRKKRGVYHVFISDLYAYMGIAYERMDKHEESKEAFLKALEINPKNREAKKHLEK